MASETAKNWWMKLRCAAMVPIAGAAIAISACSAVRIDQAADVVTGLVSHTLCSSVFISGLDPDEVYIESLEPRPGMNFIDWGIRYQVDQHRRQVSSTIMGWFQSRAVYRGKFGCLLVRAAEPAFNDTIPVVPNDGIPYLAEIAGPEVIEPTDDRLRAALEREFKEPNSPPYKRTKAVVVVYGDRVIAERYAPGYGVNTPLLGYSATKSVMNALVGILVRKKQLAVENPAPVNAWSDRSDPRHEITTDNLLRMTSGLDLYEGGPFSPVARMLYLEPDMAKYAESAPLAEKPGSTWNYTSGNTLIVSRIVRDSVGGHAQDVLRFAHRELFGPLGMRSAVLEFDATGTPVGSTYMLASARDWARFGLLYLNNGVIGGRRILPENWIYYTTMPTLSTGYGAGFWLNRVAGNVPSEEISWGIPGAPSDAFFARGIFGQFIVVIPSQQLVVVRLGAADGPDFDTKGVGRLISDIIAILPHRQG
jgi:CubicO group peptidase (beta-lactamase class C family)